MSLNRRVCIGGLVAYYIYNGYGPLEPAQLTPNPKNKNEQHKNNQMIVLMNTGVSLME